MDLPHISLSGIPYSHEESDSNNFLINSISGFTRWPGNQDRPLIGRYFHLLTTDVLAFSSSVNWLRDLGVLGNKCKNFPKWLLFGILIAMLFSLHKDIIGYPYE